jgi:hypothetical protein
MEKKIENKLVIRSTLLYKLQVIICIVVYKEKNVVNAKKNKLRLNVYVLPYMVVTRDTTPFERSLLNADASLNAVQIIQKQEYNNGKKETKEQKYQKARRKLEIILAIYNFVIYNKQKSRKTTKKKKKGIEIELLRTAIHVDNV